LKAYIRCHGAKCSGAVGIVISPFTPGLNPSGSRGQSIMARKMHGLPRDHDPRRNFFAAWFLAIDGLWPAMDRRGWR
jgi:hypothetical protein